MKDKVLAHWGAFIKGESMIILDISEYLLNAILLMIIIHYLVFLINKIKVD